MDIQQQEQFKQLIKSLGIADIEFNENGEIQTISSISDCVVGFADLRIALKVWQAAKANAVPKGFALVNQKELLELTIAINAVDLATHTESKTNEVREMWQQVALKLMALGTAQEPSHD